MFTHEMASRKSSTVLLGVRENGKYADDFLRSGTTVEDEEDRLVLLGL